MDEFTLLWEGPFTVSEIKEKLLRVNPEKLFKDPKYACLSWPGIYVFYDRNKMLYVGQANKGRGYPLRWRLRQHIKNETVIAKRFTENNIYINKLSIIVTPFNLENDIRIIKINQIEQALICSCMPPANVKENIKIINEGNRGPIPEKIFLVF